MKYGAEQNLRSIIALCENPHWTAERRWRIAELARESLEQVRYYKTLNKTVAELDDECEGGTDE